MTKNYIINKETEEIIEVYRDGSLRENFLNKIISKPIKDQYIYIDKFILENQIDNLLEKRKDEIPIAFGNRFDFDQCYNIKEFKGVTYQLETSGFDNLIIFALNLYDNADHNLFLKERK